MVDVMLVLLIIFMIVTPLLQQGVSVNLPRDMISPDEDGIAKDTSVIIAIPDKTISISAKNSIRLMPWAKVKS